MKNMMFEKRLSSSEMMKMPINTTTISTTTTTMLVQMNTMKVIVWNMKDEYERFILTPVKKNTVYFFFNFKVLFCLLKSRCMGQCRSKFAFGVV